MIIPLGLDQYFCSSGDRVPDHVGGPRKRKSVSCIDTAISGNAGKRIKVLSVKKL
jgi:hypothetical protein